MSEVIFEDTLRGILMGIFGLILVFSPWVLMHLFLKAMFGKIWTDKFDSLFGDKD